MDTQEEIERLRKKEISFGIWQGDALERIHDLEIDLEQARKELHKYQNALSRLNEMLGIAANYAMLQANVIDDEVFSKDMAPFKNVMAYHGVEPYAKNKQNRTKKHK